MHAPKFEKAGYTLADWREWDDETRRMKIKHFTKKG